MLERESINPWVLLLDIVGTHCIFTFSVLVSPKWEEADADNRRFFLCG